jgi:hypothetical protein
MSNARAILAVAKGINATIEAAASTMHNASEAQIEMHEHRRPVERVVSAAPVPMAELRAYAIDIRNSLVIAALCILVIVLLIIYKSRLHKSRGKNVPLPIDYRVQKELLQDAED